MTPRTVVPAASGAVGTGVAWALAAPPVSWWPLLPAGVAVLSLTVRGHRRRARLAIGGLAGLVFYGLTLRWVVDFSSAGYVAVALLEAALLAGAVALAPSGPGPGDGRSAWRWAAMPAALVLLEALQVRFPLGGFALPAMSLTQLDAPWAAAAPLGGSLALTAAAAATGAGLAAVVVTAGLRRRLAVLAVAGAVAGLPALAGAEVRTTPVGQLAVAVVQGGGPRGTRAVFTDASQVTGRQLQVAARLTGPTDVVLFAEGIVDPGGPLAGSAEEPPFQALARRLRATVVVGAVEAEASGFRNAALAYGPSGVLQGRYDKEHRVPFGEYMPARGLLERLTSATALVPKDAIAGRGQAVLPSAAGPLGVVISYEVFFADRVREAVTAGGRLVLVPTNASSYAGAQVPTIEVAAARLRAREFGRTVVQAAPTGYSAVVRADGRVLQRSGLGQPALLQDRAELRTGLTPYARLGDLPVLAVAALVLAGRTVAPGGARVARRAGFLR